MVPEALAGPGSRGARLGPHGKRAARRAKGLEGALVDRARHTISSLDPPDQRHITLWVAGPGALLVAKVHKIAERVGQRNRVSDKDALDVLRLLRAVDVLRLLAPSTLTTWLVVCASWVTTSCRGPSQPRRSTCCRSSSAAKQVAVSRWPSEPPDGPRTKRSSLRPSWHWSRISEGVSHKCQGARADQVLAHLEQARPSDRVLHPRRR
jgi:hypothetical protein